MPFPGPAMAVVVWGPCVLDPDAGVQDAMLTTRLMVLARTTVPKR